MNQDLTALTTYLCKRYQVPMPFVKFVDDSHWVEGGCEGYYILRIHLITLCKGTRIPELALCHEFGHFLADIKNRVEKSNHQRRRPRKPEHQDWGLRDPENPEGSAPSHPGECQPS